MKIFLFGLLIGVFIGIGFGMAWRIEQERTYIIPQIHEECDNQIRYYQNRADNCFKLVSSKLLKGRK